MNDPNVVPRPHAFLFQFTGRTRNYVALIHNYYIIYSFFDLCFFLLYPKLRVPQTFGRQYHTPYGPPLRRRIIHISQRIIAYRMRIIHHGSVCAQWSSVSGVQVSGDITSFSVVFDRFRCVRIIAYQVCPETRQRINAYQCVS